MLELGGVLVLAIVAVVVFAMTFDPNRYKGQIEAAVEEKTRRTLKLAGNLDFEQGCVVLCAFSRS